MRPDDGCGAVTGAATEFRQQGQRVLDSPRAPGNRQSAASTSKSPRPCVPCDHNSAAMPSEQVLRWAAGVVGGTRVRSAENLSRSDHRPCGTFRRRIDLPAARAADVILRVPVPRWILDGMVITNARALRLAETHGLAAPRLIAADLDGRASGTVATLETFLSGSSDLPPTVSLPGSGKPEPPLPGSTPSAWSHRPTCRTGPCSSPSTTAPPSAGGAGCRPHPYCGRPTNGSGRTARPPPRRCSCMATSGAATCCGRATVASH